jgi:hypothetical protein
LPVNKTNSDTIANNDPLRVLGMQALYTYVNRSSTLNAPVCVAISETAAPTSATLSDIPHRLSAVCSLACFAKECSVCRMHPPHTAPHSRIFGGPSHFSEGSNKQTNSVVFSPQANYTDWPTATCWRNLVPPFADRVVSRGHRGGSHTVINLSFLDLSPLFSSVHKTIISRINTAIFWDIAPCCRMWTDVSEERSELPLCEPQILWVRKSRTLVDSHQHE